MSVSKLLVSGCSFTKGNSWAKFLSNHLGVDLINLAVDGAGNRHIANSIILYLEQNQIDKENTVIIVMWSGITRRDWIVEDDRRYNHLYQNYQYTNDTRLAIPSEILERTKLKNNKARFNSELEILDIAYGSHKHHAWVIDSWLAIDHFNSYLKAHKYRYLQTNFYAPTQALDDNCPFKGLNYTNWLSKVGLSIASYDGFIPFDSQEYLGNWTYNRGEILNGGETLPDYHPTMDGHQSWTKDILIPKISKFLI